MQGVQKEPRTFDHDGLRLVGDAYGPINGPAVILLHGGGQTRHAWGDSARRMGERGYHALAMDLRGHGDSAWAGEGGYRLEHFVGDLRFVASQLGRPPAVIGASLGGLTALMAQGERPELARAVVLVDIATSAQVKGIRRIVDFMTARPDGFASLEEVADAIAAYQPQRRRPTNLDGLAKNVRRGEDGRYRWHWDPAFIQGNGPDDSPLRKDRLVAAARKLTVPTLLVRGRQSDVVAREDAKEFLQYVPHAEYVDVSEAGHMVAGDSNDVFSRAVIDFLDRLPD